MVTKIYEGPLILLAIIAVSCNGGNIQERNNESVESSAFTLGKLLEISSTSKNPHQPLVSNFNGVAVGLKGTIFVYDARQGKFSVFNKTGKYIDSFGRPGKGPGEIGQITSLVVNSKGNLITSDNENARFTIYNKHGEVLKIKTQKVGYINDIREMPKGRYVVTGSYNRHLIHIYDSTLTNVEASFGKISDFFQTDKTGEKHWFQFVTGNVHPLSSKKIAFTPSFYQGVIYVYSKMGKFKWELIKQVDGYKSIKPFVTFSSTEPEPSDLNAGMTASGGSILYVQRKSQSYGFYKGPNNSMIHLSVNYSGDSTKIVIEHFTTDELHLKGYAINSFYNDDGGLNKYIHVINNGKLYMTIFKGVPKLRVSKIIYKD